jgi:tripartite-type tricarboxylate transporter receptor subunit TctC
MINSFKNGARRAVCASLVLAGLGFLPQALAQDSFPNKSIRLVVPFAPGGVTDTSGRLIAENLSKRLGQQVFVENKPGASGNIGTAQVANAEPDGYTLVLGFDGTMVINPHVFEKIPFDTLKDFAPVGKIGNAILILVANPALPAKTLQEVVALSKQQSGGLSYGTSGIGGTPHIAGELLNQQTNAKLLHVPYKGGGQALIDVQGGTIPLVFTAVAGAYQLVMNGRVVPIAVSSAQRASSLPEVPTFIEAGLKDFVVDSWVGIFAPAKTPVAVVTKLNSALNEVLKDPEVIAKLNTLGITAAPGSPEKFREEIKNDLTRYSAIVKAANIRVD